MRHGSFRNYGYFKLLAQLEIDFADGRRLVVVSDEKWKFTTNGQIAEPRQFENFGAKIRLRLK